jgi:nicotinamidase-related amidase
MKIWRKKKKRCLVIVDMQWDFSSSREDWLIQNIIKVIKGYVKRNEPIIVLEYEGHGSTHQKIKALIKDYEKVYIRTKYNDDGGEEVGCIVHNHGLEVDEWEVCGVNLDACVVATVITMARDFCKSIITVLGDCCNSNGFDPVCHFEDDLSDYGNPDNVRLTEYIGYNS